MRRRIFSASAATKNSGAWQVNALFGWAGAPGYVSAQRTRCVGPEWKNGWVWTAARAQWKAQGSEQGPGTGAFSLRFLCYLLFHRPSTPPVHYSTTPFPARFPATFCAVFLCMGWRPVASPRKRRSGKKPMWIEIGSSPYETRQEETVESILRSFGCRASTREPRPTEGPCGGHDGFVPQRFSGCRRRAQGRRK